jgi:hypothetical protein
MENRSRHFLSYIIAIIAAVSLLFAISVLLCSCNGDYGSGHELRWTTDRTDSAVYVRYKDDAGTYHAFFMNSRLFDSLYNAGGYREVYGYPGPRLVQRTPRHYSNYKMMDSVNPYIRYKTNSLK